MVTRNLIRIVVGLICLWAVIGLSCSTDSETYVGSPPIPDVYDATYYFPLNQGYTTTYEIRSANGSRDFATFEVGKEVPFLGTIAHEWFSISDATVDIGYFVVTSTELFYYKDVNSTPEKILQIPLNPGRSWYRYYGDQEIDDNGNDDFTDIITDDRNKYEDEDTTVTDSGFQKLSFPTTGYWEMTVEQVERLELSNSDFYSDAVRISNGGNAGKTNYYWYVPGVGLVRYVISASPDSYPNGDIVGELVHYGY
jgi:hypothetical protein